MSLPSSMSHTAQERVEDAGQREAAREDLSPQSSPPTLATDKNDGGFCFGPPEPHFGEGKDNEYSF